MQWNRHIPWHYPARRACALRALGLLLADGALTVGRGKTFWCVGQVIVGHFLMARTFPPRFIEKGPKSWFLAKKSNFCQTTPILVHGWRVKKSSPSPLWGHRLPVTALALSARLGQLFLSYPSPNIGYSCHSLTHWFPNSVLFRRLDACELCQLLDDACSSEKLFLRTVTP